MTPRSHKTALTLALVCWVLTACAYFGVPTPKTFEERAAAAYSVNAGVRDAAASLLVAGKITVDDARNVQTQADNARAGIDVARAIHATDPQAAENRLEAILVGLRAIEAYLRSREDPT